MRVCILFKFLFTTILALTLSGCIRGKAHPPPTAEIIHPLSPDNLSGIIRVSGKASPSDGLTITSVTCLFDTDIINPVNGLENWWVDIDTTHYSPGVHTISICIKDSSGKSSLLSVDVEIVSVPGGNLEILRSLKTTSITDYLDITSQLNNLEGARVTYLSSNELADPVEVGSTIIKPIGDGPFPCIIFNHGGIGGTVNQDLLKKLAMRGYAVFASDYQGHNTFSTSPPDLLGSEPYDCITMLILAKSMTFVDTANIYMLGESRGTAVTILTLDRMGMLGISDYIKGASVTANLYDLETAEQDGINPAEQAAIEYFMGLKNLSFNEAIDELQRRSGGNIYNHDDIVTPMFIGHGQLDEGFPSFHSQKLADDMNSQGVLYSLHIYPDLGHVLITDDDVMNDIFTFWNSL